MHKNKKILCSFSENVKKIGKQCLFIVTTLGCILHLAFDFEFLTGLSWGVFLKKGVLLYISHSSLLTNFRRS